MGDRPLSSPLRASWKPAIEGQVSPLAHVDPPGRMVRRKRRCHSHLRSPHTAVPREARQTSSARLELSSRLSNVVGHLRRTHGMLSPYMAFQAKQTIRQCRHRQRFSLWQRQRSAGLLPQRCRRLQDSTGTTTGTSCLRRAAARERETVAHDSLRLHEGSRCRTLQASAVHRRNRGVARIIIESAFSSLGYWRSVDVPVRAWQTSPTRWLPLVSIVASVRAKSLALIEAGWPRA